MPRQSKKTTTHESPPAALEPGIGHNQLNDEQREALWLRHLDSIEAQKRQLDAWKSAGKPLKKEYNRLRNVCSGDGFPLAIVDEILEEQEKPESDIRDHAEVRHWMREKAGLPNGGQQNLLARVANSAKDEISAEADGWRAGRRGLERKPPPHVHPDCHQAWLKKYDEGVEHNAWALADSGKVIDRDTRLRPGPITLEPEAPADTEDEEKARIAKMPVEELAAALVAKGIQFTALGNPMRRAESEAALLKANGFASEQAAA